MNDTQVTPEQPPDDRPGAAPTTSRDETARVLASALDEAGWAQVRFRRRIPVRGYHGEDFEQRWRRVQQIVATYDAHVVEDARLRASDAGWTEQDLAARGLGPAR